uniref:Bzip1 n=1 Tax=Arundo donax TaxID=35708 RepID=A0A0A9BI36_ARUDO
MLRYIHTLMVSCIPSCPLWYTH